VAKPKLVVGRHYRGESREPRDAEAERKARLGGRSRVKTVFSMARPHDPQQYRAAMHAARMERMREILETEFTKRFHELIEAGKSPDDALAEIAGAAEGRA
jgi:hypothetical protein